VREKGYTVHRANKTYRAYPKSGSTMIKTACIKDRGLPGKGPQLFGELKKGLLRKHGYVYRKPTEERHEALRRAAREYGRLNLFHKLDAVYKLSQRAAPEASRIFKADRDWVRLVLMKKA
jgi:hypothetical protein